MTLSYLKALGLLHGALGASVLVSLPFAYYDGALFNLGRGMAALRVAGAVVGGALLLACMLSTWSYPGLASTLAWISLAVYVLVGASGAITAYGSAFAKHLMPTFYYATIVRAAAAVVLWLLASGLTTASG